MQCPVCKTEAVITKQKMVYSTEEGKLYRVLTYSCRNKKCKNFEKEIGEVRNELPVETE
ncbi:MAG: hypothetical protein II740_03555 [Lachnospiraceae bacterium]|jgi:hypothetical protein|nr:hypothetical protein [Lachnospiraceae bacterium]